MRVMLDPGHGGAYPGAVGSAGVPEKDVALAMALQVAGNFGMNDAHQCHLTRYADHDFNPYDLGADLQARCRLANTWGAHCFVSIHCNAYTDPAAHGYEVWTNREADAADYLAGLIWYRMRQAFPDMRGRADFADGDPDKESQFAVLVGTNMPAVLVELAFITNDADQRRLLDPAWQAREATVIADACREWAP